MLKKKIFVIALSFLLILLLPACNLPSGTSVAAATNAAPLDATAAIQTQAAGMVAATLAAANTLTNVAAGTMTAMPTDTPAFTFTPTLTLTLTFTSTPSIPMVSVSADTYCRAGPGSPYDILSTLEVGKTAQVVGRSLDGSSWIIQNPANPATTCWLWAQYATVTGNWQSLPIVNPPPTPTPQANVKITYEGMVTCSGQYGFTFQISNTGSVTWESVKIVMKDTVTSTVKTHTRDSFKSYSGCTASGEDQNLEAGEVGKATSVSPGQFTYDPSDHAMKAVVTVCSENGLAGTCMSKTLTFTP